MQALQFAIYKGLSGKHGAIQFNLQLPHYYTQGKLRDYTGREALNDQGRLKEGWKVREGAIFLEITSTKDKNEYDWENKIVVSLSVTDLGKLMKTLVSGEECKIMHDPGARSESQGLVKKYLSFSSPKGTLVGMMVSATMTSGNDKKTHTVPMNGDEVLVLRALLQSAIPKMLNW